MSLIIVGPTLVLAEIFFFTSETLCKTCARLRWQGCREEREDLQGVLRDVVDGDVLSFWAFHEDLETWEFRHGHCFSVVSWWLCCLVNRQLCLWWANCCVWVLMNVEGGLWIERAAVKVRAQKVYGVSEQSSQLYPNGPQWYAGLNKNPLDNGESSFMVPWGPGLNAFPFHGEYWAPAVRVAKSTWLLVVSRFKTHDSIVLDRWLLSGVRNVSLHLSYNSKVAMSSCIEHIEVLWCVIDCG